MIQIANVCRNLAIGQRGQLPVHCKEDMAFFRRTTLNGVCLMGRKTLDSFPGGAPLKNRVNIVLTRNPVQLENAVLLAERDRAAGLSTRLLAVTSVAEALEAVKPYDTNRVFVIGGAEIYRAFLPYSDTCLITRTELEIPDADAFYPDIFSDPGWKMTACGEQREEDGLIYRFCTYGSAD